jgi:hypothetical protein
LVLKETGNYRLVIDGTGATTDAYAFRLLDAQAATTIGLDSDVSGQLGNGQETKFYRFNGARGQKVYLDWMSDSPNTQWSLYDYAGHRLDDRAVGDYEVILANTGAYTIAVRGAHGAAVDYAFRLTNLGINPLPPDVTAQAVSFSTVVSGSIAAPGEKNVYTFNGVAGQQLFYDGLGGSGGPYGSALVAKFYDPTGQLLRTGDAQSDIGLDQGITLTADGVYQIVVEGAEIFTGTVTVTGTGSYQFQLLDTTTAEEVQLDTDIVGQLASSSSSKIYKFSLATDRYIYFDAQAGAYGAYPNLWLLYGGDGKNMLGANWPSNVIYGDQEFTLSAGNYFLVMRGNGGGDLNYKMRLVTPEFTTNAIGFNSVVSGQLSEAGEQDTFTFQGVAGQRLFYDALGSNSNFSRVIYDPTGKALSYNAYYNTTVNDAGPDFYTLSTTGTYRIVIDGNDAATGNYQFRLLDESAFLPIALDTEVTGNIDQNGTGAIGYRFNATAGQHLYLNTGGGQYPNAWLLYNINGQYINYGHIQDGYYFDDQEFDITATGEYLLFMQGAGAANTSYKFTISDSQFTTSSSPFGAQSAITIGDTVNGQIAKQGQQNTYTFSGTAGQQLQFDILSRGGYFTNVARIYNQSGTEIYSRSLYELDSADLLILRETGNYRIVVDGNGASTDAYSFRLFDVQAEVTTIGLDTDVSGRLATGQETKFYQFTGTQGQKLYFDWLSDSPNTQWSLYDRSGNRLDYRNVSDYETVLANDDTYTIAVRGYHNGAVDYSFRLVTPDVTTQVIDFRGASAVVSGNLGERGEVDVYTFAGTVGQRLVLDPQVISAGLNVRLYTPAGVPLDNVNLLTLNESGTYRIVVDGSSGATGSYSFRVLDQAAASVIQLDTEIAGTFGASGFDSNIYRLNGAAGQRLYFSTGGGADNNTWAIYDPSGNKITEGSVGTKSPSSTFNPFNEVELNLTVTGEYLVVFGGNGAANNNYRFTLGASDSVTQALTLGQKVTGSLDKFGDVDTYTFTGAIGQRLYFDGLTGSNLTGRLYSKTGVLVKERTMSNDWDGGVTLTEAGEYKFVVSGLKSNVGDYSFRLSDLSTVTALTFGSEFLGRAGTNNSAALYQFSGVNGQQLFFDIVTSGFDNLFLNWSLYDDNHRRINPAGYTGAQDFRINLPRTGEYTLAVLGDPNVPVDYRFSIVDESTPTTNISGLQVVEGEATGTFAGTISAGQVVEETFAASAGTRVYLDSRDVDDDNITILIVNPDGTVAFSRSASQDQPTTQLNQNGTYKVVIQGVSATSTGDYDFALMNVQTSQPQQFSGVRTLTLGAEITKPLENGYTTHILTFEGRVGQTLLYDGILPDGANFFTNTVGARLIGPRGEQVFNLNQFYPWSYESSARDTNPFTLTQAGTYNLEIIGSQPTPAEYRFKLLDLGQSQDLVFDRTYADNLLRGSDTNIYKFSGKAGERLFFNSSKGRVEDRWVVYRPGSYEVLVDRALTEDFELVLPTAGEYVLAVRGNSTTPGSYRFGVVKNKDNISLITPGAGESGIGGGSAVVGSYDVKLGVRDDQGGMAEQSFRIRVEPEAGNTSPVIFSVPDLSGFKSRFYQYDLDANDGDGDVLSYSFIEAPVAMLIDEATGKITWQTPEVGTYNIEVRVVDNNGGFDVQSYTLTISDVVSGKVEGSVYVDQDDNGKRKIVNPNNLTPDTSITVGDRFKENYTVYDLGVIPGARSVIGGMAFYQDPTTGQVDPNTLLVVAAAETCGTVIMKVKVHRGEGGHIIGFDDDGFIQTPYVSEFFDYSPYASVSLFYQDNVLRVPRSKNVINSAGIVPTGLPSAGDLKGASTITGGFYTVPYDFGLPRTLETANIGAAPGGFVYVPSTAMDFSAGPELLITERNANSIYAHELDANGNPITGTKDLFVSNYGSPMGIVIDPMTGDILFNGYQEPFTYPAPNNVKVARGLGKLSGNEPGLKNWLVYVDSNRDGVRQAGEEYTYTDQYGYYSFDLAPGNYVIRQDLEPSWRQTQPIDLAGHSVNLAAGQIIYDLNFGNAVATTNVKPNFVTSPVVEVTSGEKYLYRSQAVDLNADDLTYELVNAPDGMAIAADGTISWRPGDEQIGNHTVIVRVSDPSGEIDLQNFTVKVKLGNRKPVMMSSSLETNVLVGKNWTYQTAAIDPDGDRLTYSLVPNTTNANLNPVGVTIDGNTGRISWTPTAAQLGGASVWGPDRDLIAPWQITVKASDGKGGEAFQDISLIVENPVTGPNHAPVVTSQPRGQTVINQKYFYQVEATDADGDLLTYSLASKPQGMTIDANGLIAWEPTVAQIGTETVTVNVSDGQVINQQSYTLQVSNTVVNNNPDITSTPTLITNINKTYYYQPTAVDKDNDVLIWSLDAAPGGMVIDADTGLVAWNPTNNQIGVHDVRVRVTDAYGLASIQVFTLDVNGVNTPPRIQSNPNTIAGVSSRYTYQVEATDLEGDELTYALGNRPSGMTIDDQGLVTWTPNGSQAGNQTVEVLVRDAQGATSKQTYQIVVGQGPVNQAPTINSQPGFRADVNAPYRYQVVAQDPENGLLTYGLKTAPVGMAIDAQTGLISWNSPVVGNTRIEVTVTDAGGLVAVQGYTLTARENQVPVIGSVPKTQVTVGNTYRYDVQAVDSDGDLLTYSLDADSVAKGMTIDQYGRITWQPKLGNVGAQAVVVTVKDPNGAQAVQNYSLAVLADTSKPVIELNKGTSLASLGETVVFQVAATDNVGIQARQLLVNGQAIALDSNGLGSYEVTSLGVLNVQAIVTDVNGNISTQETTVNVYDPTDATAPQVQLVLPSGNLTNITEVRGSVTDTNLDYYVLEVASLDSDSWREVFRGTANVTDGVLGKFDPTGLMNDTYRLRLTAFDTNGAGNSIEHEVEVAGELKLGNFRLSFTEFDFGDDR